LAIVEQYFAAQALLRGEVPPDDIVVNAAVMTIWRYPIAVALAVGSAVDVARIMVPIARHHPGIASWLVDEALAVSGHSRNQPEAEATAAPSLSGQAASVDETLGAGHAAQSSVVAWLDGLAELSHQFGFTTSAGQVLPLGVALAVDGSFESSWVPHGEGLPPVFCLYPPHDPAEAAKVPPVHGAVGWGAVLFQSRLTAVPHWSWRWSRDRVRSELNDVLRQRRLVPRPGGLLEAERDWRLARSLLHEVNRRHPPIDPSIVIARIEMYRGKDQYPEAIRCADGLPYARADLSRLAERCRDLVDSGELLNRPVPAPDRQHPGGGFLWENYSPELLRELTEVVWREALVGYAQIVVDHLPRVGRTLGLMALGRPKLDGVLVVSDRTDIAGAPVLEHVIGALEPGVDLDLQPVLGPGTSIPGPEVTIGLDYAANRTTEPHFRRGYSRTTLIPRGAVATAFGVPEVSSPAVDIFGDSPATTLAYQWLNRDLARFGLARAEVYRD
jgi:hypothetical protein